MGLRLSLLLCLLLAVPLCGDDAPVDPWTYYGVFRLDGGELFQGGLLEEGERALWGFGDPLEPAIGGLIYDRTSATRFVSVLRPGAVLEFSQLDADGYQAITLEEDGKVLQGRRAPRLERLDATLEVDGGELAVSLSLPLCPGGPRPLVVSIAGSGRNTRHNSIFSTFFLSRGMAVASFDKRDADPLAAGWQEQDLEEIADDASALLTWAAAQPGIDRQRVGIMGSSQGGWTGSMVAAQHPETAFLIVRAGPGVSELETHLYERRQELRAEGLAGKDLDKALQLSRQIYRRAIAGETLASTDPLVAPWLGEDWYRTAFGEGPISQRWSQRWWRWAGQNMPVSAPPHLERYAGAVLWFLGEEDQNVPLVSSHSALSATFSRSPGSDHELVVIPDVGHDFMLDMPSPRARFAPGFWDRIDSWLAERGLSDPQCVR
ncbi:MAG: prolyl oligopeptidase family serine peptidase [Acidobacteriota bacterium]